MQIGGAGRALRDVSEGVGEAGTRGNFQYQFGQVHARQHADDRLTQREQRGRFIQLVKWTEHQLIFVADLIEPHRRVVGQPGNHSAIGAIQLVGQGGQRRLGVGR